MTDSPQRDDPAVAIKATVERVRLTGEHPNIDVFKVTLLKDNGVWLETFGSEHDNGIFLRGVLAGVSMVGGRFEIPETPSAPSKYMVDQKPDSNE